MLNCVYCTVFQTQWDNNISPTPKFFIPSSWWHFHNTFNLQISFTSWLDLRNESLLKELYIIGNYFSDHTWFNNYYNCFFFQVEAFLDFDKASKGIVFTTDRSYEPGEQVKNLSFILFGEP